MCPCGAMLNIAVFPKRCNPHFAPCGARDLPRKARLPIKGDHSWRKNGPLSTPQDRKGCALDLPLPAPCKSDAAHAAQRTAYQFLLRLSIWLAPMSAWPLPLRGFERNFQRQLVPALQQRLSGKRSRPNRSEDKHRRPVAEMKHRQFGGQGACPLLSLGVAQGRFSFGKRIAPANVQPTIRRAPAIAKWQTMSYNGQKFNRMGEESHENVTKW